ncbi:30S ribosomal protein S14 [Candidatus Cyrtobacter comes]|uniref:Small ribosomal subunit protein uS14 n=1 Tax=Candidatus Cyrtobacter comes TaxID=675776 RepID=A0ABU5L768_9RICK|nr:30S ribosomal protein S14 [Candidatus Cyrtobacter comes]MDZ5761735.1 30S ribosomal protein S14 [Candidatus Cyrtobacter comes]
MPKKSVVERNLSKISVYHKYLVERSEIRSIARDKKATLEERFKASMKLAKMPRDSSPCRSKKRCNVSGRSAGYYGFFGVSRIVLRSLALAGQMPGVRKASW